MPMASDPRIRASDADRDRTAALLREHHAAGRLTAEEFADRMDKALEAKTMGELDELPADPHRSASPVKFTPGGVAIGAWGVVTAALVAIWAVAAVIGGGTWFPWW